MSEIYHYQSPSGADIIGTLEHLSGCASIAGISGDGTPEYSNGTEIYWDDQVSVIRNGKLVYLDENGAEWTFDQLVRIGEVL